MWMDADLRSSESCSVSWECSSRLMDQPSWSRATQKCWLPSMDPMKCVDMTFFTSLVPKPCPAFHHLQFCKQWEAGQGLGTRLLFRSCVQVKIKYIFVVPTFYVTSFPGHSQILFAAVEKTRAQATPRFYLAAVEKLEFLHSCEIKSGSGLETRLLLMPTIHIQTELHKDYKQSQCLATKPAGFVLDPSFFHLHTCNLNIQVTRRSEALHDRVMINCQFSMATFSTSERKKRPKGDRYTLCSNVTLNLMNPSPVSRV